VATPGASRRSRTGLTPPLRGPRQNGRAPRIPEKPRRGRSVMHALDILGDPVRRRILELLARGAQASGDIVAVIEREFGISQSAVSQHLRVLRDNGFASVRSDGARRVYSVEQG